MAERFPNKLGHHTLVINCQQPHAMHAPGPYLVVYNIHMYLLNASRCFKNLRSKEVSPSNWFDVCIFHIRPASVESPGALQAVTCTKGHLEDSWGFYRWSGRILCRLKNAGNRKDPKKAQWHMTRVHLFALECLFEEVCVCAAQQYACHMLNRPFAGKTIRTIHDLNCCIAD